MKNPEIIIKTKIDGKPQSPIILELYPQEAPITVSNFLELTNKGFYSNLIFHRVIKNFMIQGGDPNGTGMGGPGYSIKGEFTKNGVNNKISHKKGIISMARSQAPDSAGSQFFICHGDATYLDGSYAAFGKVIKGLETVDKIAHVSTNSQDRPEIECQIESIQANLNGFSILNFKKLGE